MQRAALLLVTAGLSVVAFAPLAHTGHAAGLSSTAAGGANGGNEGGGATGGWGSSWGGGGGASVEDLMELWRTMDRPFAFGVFCVLAGTALHALVYVLQEMTLVHDEPGSGSEGTVRLLSSPKRLTPTERGLDPPHLCGLIGLMGSAVVTSHAAVFTIPNWEARVLASVFDHGGTPRIIGASYGGKTLTDFCHGWAYFHLMGRLGATSMSVLKAVVAAASFFSSVAFFCNKRCCVAREQVPGNVCPLPRVLLPRRSSSSRRATSSSIGSIGSSGAFGSNGGVFSGAPVVLSQSPAELRGHIELPRRRSSFFCHYSPSQVSDFPACSPLAVIFSSQPSLLAHSAVTPRPRLVSLSVCLLLLPVAVLHADKGAVALPSAVWGAVVHCVVTHAPQMARAGGRGVGR